MNRTVFITGSCSGIGLSIAKVFVEHNYDVAINYSSKAKEAKAQEILKLLEEESAKKSLKVKIKAYMANISNTEEVEIMAKSILTDFAKLDVLVNCAGITADALSFRLTDENWNKVIDTNLTGTFKVCRAFIPSMMRNRSGNIINISSIVGIHGNIGQINYSSSKAGIIALTKTLAKELSSRGILVNAVAPGAVDTEMFNKIDSNIKDAIIKNIPLGRVAKAEEIADLVYYLANQSYITGQVISIDGGMGI